ncbi:MAG: DNA-binding response regulator [Bacteroidetes bacterium 4572_117]|nr:MAG: DNA-binding response regulator [Bacteroidetes bacterium 4572_117]
MADFKGYKILIVDDEADILEFLSYNLEKEGFKVYTAQNGAEAIKKTVKKAPQLILMDVMMPEMDGIEACEKIRQIPGYDDIIIAFLTARGEDYSQIAGFDAGADDYITKPIKPKVLISRIKALLKRYIKSSHKKNIEKNLVKKGNLIIDKEKYVVFNGEKEINLPKKEFSLLLLLVSKPQKVFTRQDIFAKVWGNDIIVGDRTIDVHIRKLREKIGGECIVTVKGIGYKFVE